MEYRTLAPKELTPSLFSSFIRRQTVLLEYLEDSVRKNGAAREAILAGAGTHADEHEEGSPEEDGLNRIPERSRNRLVQLEREADLAKKLAAWMRSGD